MSGEYKQSTKLRLLNQVISKIVNPQIIQAYPVDLDGQSGGETGGDVLREWLVIDKTDTVQTMILKLLAFYLGCGRVFAVATVPVEFPTKAQALRPQLAIVYHAVNKKTLKSGKSRGEYQHTIPHYIGGAEPELPIYTLGQHTCTYFLTDSSYIMVNAQTPEMAEKMVIHLAQYTDPKMRPEGRIEDNLKTTKRRGKKIDNVRLKPHRIDYYEGRGKGFRPIWQMNAKAIQLEGI